MSAKRAVTRRRSSRAPGQLAEPALGAGSGELSLSRADVDGAASWRPHSAQNRADNALIAPQAQTRSSDRPVCSDKGSPRSFATVPVDLAPCVTFSQGIDILPRVTSDGLPPVSSARADGTGNARFHVLSTLTPEVRDAVVSAAGRRRFRSRETLVHAGDHGETMFLIDGGHAAVRRVTEYGDDTTFAVLGPGDSFGELAMLSEGGRRSASVVALEPVSVLTISRGQLESALGGVSGVQALMVRMLGQQVHRLSAQLVEARFVPVRHRVARALLELCDQYADTGTRISLRITQDDVAGLAGATRPTVNQVLRSLESAGAIELRRGRIEVLDRELLVRHGG